VTSTQEFLQNDEDDAERYSRDDIPSLYQSGHSLNEVSRMTGISYPTVRRDLIAAGVEILSRKEAVARFPGGWNKQRVGERRPPTSDEARKKMRESAASRWLRDGVKGFSIDKNGYVKITSGPNYDRDLHVVLMEQRIGRRLLPDENVHHIDRDPSNNNEDNLALVTKAGHGRLHRFEDRLAGIVRAKGKDGRFVSSKPSNQE